MQRYLRAPNIVLVCWITVSTLNIGLALSISCSGAI